jgi:hypothetical protein
VRSQEYWVRIELPQLFQIRCLQGSLPRRAHALVVEWASLHASLHKGELMKNWDRCQRPAPAVPIEPLE